jgi:uncharacterized protein (DUF362 family)
VAIVHDPFVRDNNRNPKPDRIHNLADLALQTCFDRDSPKEAWSLVVRPGLTVGLKVNCLGWLGMSTSVALVEGICERLQENGVRKDRIIVWDRLNQDLERANFRISENPNSIRFYGNDYLGYEPNLETFGSVGSLLCKTFTRQCDVVINLTLLKDHGITGYTGALKNLFGAIHNPNKYHLNTGNPYIPDVWMLNSVRGKICLNICEAIDAQYNGGPSYMPQWTWEHNRIMVSTDPVALDWIGWKTLEKKRKEDGLPTLKEDGREPRYIITASDQEHQLGTVEKKQIQQVEVEA